MAMQSVFRFHLIMAISVWLVWLMLGGQRAVLALIENWPISLTMVFGSFIAGATSEGGGAVAFPVFTKVLKIDPAQAKVFSLAIQSVGMTAASLLILRMRVAVDWWVVRWVSLAGIPGILLGTLWLAPMLSAPAVKLSFTLLVTSFAVTLFVLNRGERSVHAQVPLRGRRELVLIMLAGLVGGVFSGLVGNGIDIVSFSVLVLLFHVSEKVATPTSVVLMAINSLMGFALHGFHLGTFSGAVVDWWLAALPIVVIGAPLGAMLCAHLDRVSIARFLLFLITIELFTSLWLIPIDQPLAMGGGLVMFVFTGLYAWMYRVRRYQPTF